MVTTIVQESAEMGKPGMRAVFLDLARQRGSTMIDARGELLDIERMFVYNGTVRNV